MERTNRSCKSQVGCAVIGNVHASMAKRDGRGTRALGSIHEGKRQNLRDEWISMQIESHVEWSACLPLRVCIAMSISLQVRESHPTEVFALLVLSHPRRPVR